MKINWRTQVKLLIGSVLILFLLSTESFGQNCPSFQIKDIKNVQGDIDNGSATIKIKGTRSYSESNFEVRQKEKNVTGPVGFEIKISVVGDELVVSGLKSSDKLYLEEYVILFSDKSCDNSRVVEVGTFKIN